MYYRVRFAEREDDPNSLKHWKYIKRWKEKGEWKYLYPYDAVSTTKTATAKVKFTKSKTNEETTKLTSAKNVASVSKTSATNDDPGRSKKNVKEVLKELWSKTVNEVSDAVKKGAEAVKKAFAVTHKTEYNGVDADEYSKKNEEERKKKAEEEAKKKAEEEAKKKAEEEAKRKAEEEAKKYKAAQDKERTEVREPELAKQIEELTAKNFFGKFENNPLPELGLKESATTLDEDMALINPNYDPDNPNTSQNCALCTIAYDLRRRGYDVVANEQVSDISIHNIYDVYEDVEVYTTDKMLELVGKAGGDQITPDDMKKAILTHGEGARGNLAVYWKQGGAHSVAWEIENGELILRDCQTNKKIKFDDYYWSHIKTVQCIRTDNLTPTEKALEYVHNRKDDNS